MISFSMVKFVLPRVILAALAITDSGALSAMAQSATSAPVTISKTVTPTTQIPAGATAPANAPAKNIGAAPANSNQSKILSSALTPQTRQTLQQAMNAMFDDEKPQRSAK